MCPRIIRGADQFDLFLQLASLDLIQFRGNDNGPVYGRVFLPGKDADIRQAALRRNSETESAAALDFTPDGTITFVESQIAAGADGLFLCPPAESVLPTITQLCDEAGVYWGITLRTIEDEEIRKMVEGSEYYVGNCYENEEDTAEETQKDEAEEAESETVGQASDQEGQEERE